MSRVAAVILAGGRGERLGGANKALVEIGGRRLIDRVGSAARGCAPLLVAAGRTPFPVPGAQVVVDLESDYAGPLAGVAAAVAALADDHPAWLLSLAVDTPFFPADFLARALSVSDGVDVVLGTYGTQDYPTNALWWFDAVSDLPAQLRDGTAPRSLRRLAASLRSTRIDYAQILAEDPFANVNTAEDLINLRLRDARMTRG